MPRDLSGVRLLLMTSLALLGLTCGSSGQPETETCGNPDSSLTCTDVCADIQEFRRFQCTKPPYMLCNANMDAAKPLNKAEVDYVMAKCRNCSGCSKNCQSCGFTFPF